MKTLSRTLIVSAILAGAPAGISLAETDPPAFAQGTTATRIICGKVPGTSFDARGKTIRTLGKSIPSDDFALLTAFLGKTPADDPATPDELDALKNDVAGRLLNCDHLPDNFSEKFLAMIDAPHVGTVWQNYTVQFLDALWRRETDAGKRRSIYNKLIACTRDTRLAIPGTAVLALARLAEKAGLSNRELGDIAMRIVEDEKIAWQDKTTALQVAAQTGDTRALDAARTWAAGENAPVMQRMSAFAVLGMLGDAGDKPVLEKYAGTGEFRLRTAARAALKKINVKNLTTDSTDDTGDLVQPQKSAENAKISR